MPFRSFPFFGDRINNARFERKLKGVLTTPFFNASLKKVVRATPKAKNRSLFFGLETRTSLPGQKVYRSITDQVRFTQKQKAAWQDGGFFSLTNGEY